MDYWLIVDKDDVSIEAFPAKETAAKWAACYDNDEPNFAPHRAIKVREVPEKPGEMSDGYHTFDELYDHRCLLWILWLTSSGYPLGYRIPDHLEGWDLLGAETEAGQISYHVPVKYRPLYEHAVPLALAGYKWDGHTSADVIERLKKTIERIEEEG